MSNLEEIKQQFVQITAEQYQVVEVLIQWGIPPPKAEEHALRLSPLLHETHRTLNRLGESTPTFQAVRSTWTILYEEQKRNLAELRDISK